MVASPYRLHYDVTKPLRSEQATPFWGDLTLTDFGLPYGLVTKSICEGGTKSLGSCRKLVTTLLTDS